MNSEPLQYFTGEEVRSGDRVQYRSQYSTVVFVSNGDSEEFTPGYEDFLGSDRGVVVCDDDGTVTRVGEPDPELIFIDHG